MDAREAALAKAVGATVDAWLLLAVESWRARREVAPADDGDATGATSSAAALLSEKLHRAQHNAHLRAHTTQATGETPRNPRKPPTLPSRILTQPGDTS